MKMMDAVLKVLETNKEPLSAQDIYTKILDHQYFEFKSKNPLSILKSQLRRNSVSLTRKSAVAHPVLDELEGKLFRIR